MKLSFDIINKNFKLVKKAKDLFPQIEKNEISWNEIRTLGLCNVSNLNTTLNRINDIDLATGKKSMRFDDLKPLLEKYSDELYKEGKRIAYDDWQNPSDEVKALKSIKKELKNVTKEKFDSFFTSLDKYETIFPYLWRIEKSLNNYLLYEIFNYLVTEQVEVFEGIKEVYDYEYFTKEVKFDKSKSIDLSNKVKNSDKLISNFLDSIKSELNSGDIELDYLKEKLNTKLNKIEN